MGHGNNVEKNMLKPREDPLIDSDDERPESFDEKGYRLGYHT